MPRKIREENKNSKSVRWEMILKLIASKEIGTQSELADELNSLGFDVTQATVSRDIKELALIKSAKRGGGYRYEAPRDNAKFKASDKFYTLFTTTAVHVDSALNQVVIHCYTGMANAICAAMDGLSWDGVLGTIAGDDTILVICHSEAQAQGLARRLRDILSKEGR